MAEIRKHSPVAGALGDLVRASIGAGPRPFEPGRPAASPDPFDRPDQPTPTRPSVTTVTTTPVATWTAVSLDQLPTVPKKTASREDDLIDDDDLVDGEDD
jgi:hypothetical protein